jgi:hypothetical protein
LLLTFTADNLINAEDKFVLIGDNFGDYVLLTFTAENLINTDDKFILAGENFGD